MFGTHTLYRTKAVLIYRRTGNLSGRKDDEVLNLVYPSDA
jgi:hypothetical protein